MQKMQELLSEREDIQSEYKQLEQEYMLVASELNAAKDRITKLLTHLERYIRVRKQCVKRVSNAVLRYQQVNPQD